MDKLLILAVGLAITSITIVNLALCVAASRENKLSNFKENGDVK